MQLEAVREQAAQHETELRNELQQARRDKQLAEAKLAGLDLKHMEVCCLPHIACAKHMLLIVDSSTCLNRAVDGAGTNHERPDLR